MFALSVLVAAAILFVPGALMVRALGPSWAAAVPLAPVVSVALCGTLAVVYSLAGVPASPVTLFAPMLVVGVLLMTFRRGRATSRCEVVDVSGELSLRVRHDRGPSWSAASIAVAVVAALLVTTVVFLANIGSPESYLNNYDSAFHLSRVRSFVDTGDYAQLSNGFYPSAWHAVAAMTCWVTGCGAASGIHASIVAFIVLVFPSGVFYFLATLFPDRPRRVFLGSLFCLCVAFFPWRIMLFGPLYPNIASFALMPAVVALFIRLIGPGKNASGRGLCGALFVLGGVALVLTQPNTVFFSALYLVPCCMYRIRIAFATSRFGQRRVWLGVLLEVLFLLLALLLWVGALSLPFMEPLVEYERAVPIGVTKAISRLLTFQFVIWRPQYLLFLISAVGGIALLVRREHRWMTFSYAVIGAVYVVSISVDGPLRGLVSGFCYNDYYRTAAAACVFVLPLVASGLDCAVRGIELACNRLAKAKKKDGTGGVAATVLSVAAVVLVIGFNYFPLFDIPRFASWGFDAVAYETRESYTNEINHYYREEESSFVDEAHALVGDAAIANQPYDGSVFSYADNGLNVVFSAFGAAPSSDARVLREGLCRISEDRQVQEAAQRLGVRYVILLDQSPDVAGMNPGGTTYDLGYLDEEWVGIDGIRDDTPGFRVLLSQGDMRLYEIVA